MFRKSPWSLRAPTVSNAFGPGRRSALGFGRRTGPVPWAAILAVSLVVLLLVEGLQDVTTQSSLATGARPAAPAVHSAMAAAVVYTAASSPVPARSTPGYASLCLLGAIPQCALRESGGTGIPVPLVADPPSSWADITPPSGQPNPPGRYLSAMAYDPATHYVLLFGGYGELGLGPWVFFQDTWEYSGGHWKQLVANTTCTPTTCPSPRAGAMLAYDASEHGMILFGGYRYTPAITIISFSDTWLFAGGHWTNLSATAGTPPSPRFAGSMVWDSYDNYVLLFGGILSPVVSAGDTWKFDGTWTNLTGSVGTAPNPRDGAAIANSPSGYIMLFGGEHGGVLWSDVGGCSYSLVAFWFFAGKWSQMAITPTCIGQPESPSPATSVTGTYPPCGRVGAGLGWSPPNNRFVLFGGQ